nr:MAG TPA: hypothetical protein [Caudoviricetes sp.]
MHYFIGNQDPEALCQCINLNSQILAIQKYPVKRGDITIKVPYLQPFSFVQ